jgi:hypothetical protein
MIKKPRQNEEAKARYWAVKIQPQLVVTAGNKQTNKNSINLSVLITEAGSFYIAVRTGSLNQKDTFSSLKGLNTP